MRQCYQREKYYPLGKSCRVGGETFSRSRCQSAHDLHWRLSDTSSLFRCGINEARPRGVEKNHFKTSHQLNVISRDCIIRNQCWNWGRGGGGDWLIVKMLWGWMDINCSSSNYKCFQMKLSVIRRSLPVFRGFFGTTHGKRQTHVTAHHTMFVFSWMQGEFVYLRHHRRAFLQPSGRGKMSTLDVSAIKEKYKYKTGRNVECLHVLFVLFFS